MSLAKEQNQQVCFLCFPSLNFTALTSSIDGAGLACGLFEYLLSLGDERPKVLAATHFHEIFEEGLMTPRPELQLGHMEVQVDTSTRRIEEQITYLYKLSLTHLAAGTGLIPDA